MGNSDNLFRQGLVRNFSYVTFVVLSISRVSLSTIFEEKKGIEFFCKLSLSQVWSAQRRHIDM